jgi:hypothetical protein
LQNISEDFDWYKKYFKELAEKKGALYAFDVLQYASIPHDVDIHLVAHQIGYVQYAQKGAAGMRECPSFFRGACSHGIVIGVYVEFGPAAIDTLAEACAVAPGPRGMFISCFHGVGHGVLAYLKYDFEATVQQCKTIADKVQEIRGPTEKVNVQGMWQECVGGAVMDLMVGDHDPEAWNLIKPKYLPVDDPLMPCNAAFLPEQVRPICYFNIARRLLDAVGAKRGIPKPESYPKALSYCEQVPPRNTANRKQCYGGFGSHFVYAANGDVRSIENMSVDKLHKVHTWCGFVPDPVGQAACVESAESGLFWDGEKDSPASLTFCRIAPNATIRDACYKRLIEAAKFYMDDPSVRGALCDVLPPEYQDSCRSEDE